jgi:flagellar biosynthesis/type III secretory pathway chaperone
MIFSWHKLCFCKATKEEHDMVMLDTNQAVNVKKDIGFESHIDSLLSLLTKEVEVYDELQTIIQEERGLLRRPSLELLSSSNKKKETCILKARMLEEVRANIVKKIARSLDRNENEMNISILSLYTEERQTNALKARQKSLLSLMQSIKESNEMNQGLLDYSLSYVKNSMNFISNLLSIGAGYAYTGKLNARNTNGRILNREG